MRVFVENTIASIGEVFTETVRRKSGTFVARGANIELSQVDRWNVVQERETDISHTVDRDRGYKEEVR